MVFFDISVFETTAIIKICKSTIFSAGSFCQISAGSFCQIYRVTDEALIAENMVWPNFFLIFFALKESKLYIIISSEVQYIKTRTWVMFTCWKGSRKTWTCTLITTLTLTYNTKSWKYRSHLDHVSSIVLINFHFNVNLVKMTQWFLRNANIKFHMLVGSDS